MIRLKIYFIRKGWLSGQLQQGAGAVAGKNEQRGPATAPAACCREEVEDTERQPTNNDTTYQKGVVVGVAAAGCRGGGWQKRATRASHCPSALMPRRGGSDCAVADK